MIRFVLSLSYEVRSEEKKKVDELFGRFQEAIKTEFNHPQLCGTMCQIETLFAPPSKKKRTAGDCAYSRRTA